MGVGGRGEEGGGEGGGADGAEDIEKQMGKREREVRMN